MPEDSRYESDERIRASMRRERRSGPQRRLANRLHKIVKTAPLAYPAKPTDTASEKDPPKSS